MKTLFISDTSSPDGALLPVAWSPQQPDELLNGQPGLPKDRAEGAGRKVGTACGDGGAAASLVVSKGDVAAGLAVADEAASLEGTDRLVA